MKEGWERKTLGSFCTFENGDRGKNYPSKSNRSVSGIPFINAGHLTDDGIDFETMDYISRERFDLLGAGKIRARDILFCLRGSLGKFASVGDLSEGAIASSLVIIRPDESVLNEYVLAYLRSDLCAEMINQFRGGTAQPNLSAKSLGEFVVPVPPLSEQRRIVAILDEAFAGIAIAKANAERNAHNAREVFESELQAVFNQRGEGWEAAKLDDVTDLITCGVAKRPEYVSTGIPFLSAKNVKNGQVVWSGYQYVSETTHNALIKHNKPELGDILYTRVGSYGEAAIIDRDIEFSIFVSLTLIKPKSSVLNLFLKHYLNSSTVKKMAAASINGVGVGNLNVGTVREFPIYLPSLSEQHHIVAKLDSLSAETQRLEAIYRQKSAALDGLKKSLLQQAFNGEL